MSQEFTTIVYWSDDEWCYAEDLEDKLQTKSDDVTFIQVPSDLTEESIDQFVRVMNTKEFA